MVVLGSAGSREREPRMPDVRSTPPYRNVALKNFGTLRPLPATFSTARGIRPGSANRVVERVAG
jgi:hypothetical protein